MLTLDRLLILGERYLHRVMKDYQDYFSHAQSHQGIRQRVPCQPVRRAEPQMIEEFVSCSVLGGLHHHYRWRAAMRPSCPRAAWRTGLFGQNSC